MKVFLEILKFSLLLGLLVFLFSFSNNRNRNRTLSKVEVEFTKGDIPLISHQTVNKLLIQNDVDPTNVGKETIVLKEMEKRLEENPMVRKAQVYVTLDGALGAQIEQRDPIARVSVGGSTPDFYIDADGGKMPLSTEYSARVPLVTGVSENDFSKMTPLLLQIREDEFMKQMVIGLNKNAQGELELQLRKTSLNVVFGKPEAIQKKFQNLKAFYKKTKQDSTIYKYEKINLKFESQVIATKREDHGKR